MYKITSKSAVLVLYFGTYICPITLISGSASPPTRVPRHLFTTAIAEWLPLLDEGNITFRLRKPTNHISSMPYVPYRKNEYNVTRQGKIVLVLFSRFTRTDTCCQRWGTLSWVVKSIRNWFSRLWSHIKILIHVLTSYNLVK